MNNYDFCHSVKVLLDINNPTTNNNNEEEEEEETNVKKAD